MANNESHKPISMLRDELMNKVAQAINESGLSYFVLEYIFKDLTNEIHNAVVQQTQAEKEAYLKQVHNEKT